jgi:hypothetical protein
MMIIETKSHIDVCLWHTLDEYPIRFSFLYYAAVNYRLDSPILVYPLAILVDAMKHLAERRDSVFAQSL